MGRTGLQVPARCVSQCCHYACETCGTTGPLPPRGHGAPRSRVLSLIGLGAFTRSRTRFAPCYSHGQVSWFTPFGRCVNRGREGLSSFLGLPRCRARTGPASIRPVGTRSSAPCPSEEISASGLQHPLSDSAVCALVRAGRRAGWRARD